MSRVDYACAVERRRPQRLRALRRFLRELWLLLRDLWRFVASSRPDL